MRNLLKSIMVLCAMIIAAQSHSQCSCTASVPLSPSEYGGTMTTHPYKAARLELWAAKPSINVDGRKWYRVKRTDTTYIGLGDTLSITADTTSQIIARNFNSCVCPDSTRNYFYSSYSVMANITTVDTGTMPTVIVSYAPKVCSGSQTNISVKSSLTFSVVQYLRDDTANVSGSFTGSASASNSGPYNFPIGITLRDKVSSSQKVRMLIRTYNYYTGFELNQKVVNLTLTPDSAVSTDPCSFPSVPVPWPWGSYYYATHVKGSYIQLIADTTIKASGVDWYKVVGTDTSYAGTGYTINVTVDSMCQYIARSKNFCNCDSSTYYSSFALMSQYYVSSGNNGPFHVLNYTPTIASGTQFDLVLRGDSGTNIYFEFWRDNAYVSGSTYLTSSINGGPEAFATKLTNTTSVPQVVKYFIRGYVPGNNKGYTYTGYITVLAAKDSALPGNHCVIPDRPSPTITASNTYVKGSVIYLNLQGAANISGSYNINLNTADSVEYFKSKGIGDTTYLGSAIPQPVNVDTTFKVYAVAKNLCYWKDSSVHIYKSAPTYIATINKLNGTSATLKMINNTPNVCNGGTVNIVDSIYASTVGTFWYRSNQQQVLGTNSGSTGSTSTGPTINPTLTDTGTLPQRVDFVSYSMYNSSNFNSQHVTSVMVYPSCAKWANFKTSIHTNRNPICYRDTATLTADTVPGVTTHYLWNTGDTTKSIRRTTASTYSVTVSNSCGCSASANLSLSVDSFHSITVNNAKIAPGHSVLLTASAAATNFTWSTGDSICCISTPTVGTYTVTATDVSGCTASASSIVSIDSSAFSIAFNSKLSFELNKGQYKDSLIKYVSGQKDISYRFLPDGVSYAKAKVDSTIDSTRVLVWNMKLDGISSSCRISPDSSSRDTSSHNGYNTFSFNPFFGVVNYYIGSDSAKWHPSVPFFGGIKYKNIYSNIDLKYYGTSDNILEYDVVVNPGGHLSNVRMHYSGVDSIKIDSSGNALISTKMGSVTEMKPLAYQIISGSKVSVPTTFTLDSGKILGFKFLASYDTTITVVVDPLIQVWSTYYGQLTDPTNQTDLFTDVGNIVADNTGIYVSGVTYASNINCFGLPASAPIAPQQYVYGLGTSNVSFTGKFSKDATTPIAATLWGGTTAMVSNPVIAMSIPWGEYDVLFDTKVDASQRVYACGVTVVNDFPNTFTSTSLTTSADYPSDGFLSVFDFSNNPTTGMGRIVYSKPFGGNGRDFPFKLAITNAANPKVYLTGFTESSDFLTSSRINSAAPCATNEDIFMIGLDPYNPSAGFITSAVWGSNSTGTCGTSPTDINMDWGRSIFYSTQTSRVLVSGFVNSNNHFPVTSHGAEITPSSSDRDGFLTVLNPSTTIASIDYSTAIGGAGNDEIVSMDCDASGNVYLLGLTESTNLPLLFTPNSGVLANAFFTGINNICGFVEVRNTSSWTHKNFSYVDYGQNLPPSNSSSATNYHGAGFIQGRLGNGFVNNIGNSWGGISIGQSTGNVYITTLYDPSVGGAFAAPADCSLQGKYHDFRLMELSGDLTHFIASSQFGAPTNHANEQPFSLLRPWVNESSTTFEAYSGFTSYDGNAETFPLSPSPYAVLSPGPKSGHQPLAAFLKFEHRSNATQTINVTPHVHVCFDGVNYFPPAPNSYVTLDANWPSNIGSSNNLTYTWTNAQGVQIFAGGVGGTNTNQTPSSFIKYTGSNNILNIFPDGNTLPQSSNEYTVSITQIDPNSSTGAICTLAVEHFFIDVTRSSITANLTPATVCSGFPITLTANTSPNDIHAQYAWSTSTNPSTILSTSSSFTVSPTATTTYNVTITDYNTTVTPTNSCSSVASITVTVVTNCCTGTYTYSNFDANNPVDLSTIPILSVGTTSSIALNGYWKAGSASGYFISNCTNIIMGPDASIEVKPGTTLSMDHTILSSQSCNIAMWKGITIDQGGGFTMTGGSTISDAKAAVTRNGDGGFNVQSSFFYRNYNNIIIQNSSLAFSGSAVNGSIIGCTFSSDPLVGNLLSPYIGLRSNSGIIVQLNPGIQIGDQSSATNSFIGLNSGIINVWSTLSVFNCKFTNIQNYNHNALSFFSNPGYAVYAYGGNGFYFNNGQFFDAPTTVSTLNSRASHVSPVTFSGCDAAIVSDWATLTVKDNSIDGSGATSPYGIWTRNVQNRGIQINENYLTNMNFGVTLANNTLSSTKVYDNRINVNNPVQRSGPFIRLMSTYGIYESEFSKDQCDKVSIYNDSIFSGLYNIWLNNTNNSSIYNNNLFMNDAYVIPLYYRQMSIYAQNSHAILISGNAIIGNGTQYDDGFPGSGFSSPSSTHRKMGVSLFLTDKSEICNNGIDNIGYGSYFSSTCNATRFRLNHISNSHFGLVLASNGTGGIIGPQGNATSENHGNLFSGTFNNSSGYQTFTISIPSISTDGRLSPFYYSGSTANPSPNGTNNSSSLYILQTVSSSSSASPSCHSIPFNCYKEFINFSPQFSMAVASEDIHSYADSSKYTGALWVSERQLFKELQDDSTQIAVDSTYNKFYADMKSSEIGTIGKIEPSIIAMAISMGDTVHLDTIKYNTLLSSAISNNNSLGSVSFSQNAKSIYSIYFRTVAHGYSIKDSSDIAFIDTLAHACPFDKGDAVYLARALYSTFAIMDAFDDDLICNPSQYRDSSKTKMLNVSPHDTTEYHDNQYYAKVYPNPAANSAVILFATEQNSTNIAELYDNLGRLVFSTKEVGDFGSITIDLTKFSSGIYMVRFISGDQVLLNSKLVIRK